MTPDNQIWIFGVAFGIFIGCIIGWGIAKWYYTRK